MIIYIIFLIFLAPSPSGILLLRMLSALVDTCLLWDSYLSNQHFSVFSTVSNSFPGVGNRQTKFRISIPKVALSTIVSPDHASRTAIDRSTFIKLKIGDTLSMYLDNCQPFHRQLISIGISPNYDNSLP
jgi:regulator of sigma D